MSTSPRRQEIYGHHENCIGRYSHQPLVRERASMSDCRAVKGSELMKLHILAVTYLFILSLAFILSPALKTRAFFYQIKFTPIHLPNLLIPYELCVQDIITFEKLPLDCRKRWDLIVIMHTSTTRIDTPYQIDVLRYETMKTHLGLFIEYLYRSKEIEAPWPPFFH